MPIGVFVCFSPVIIAWVLASTKRPGKREEEQRR
jgi:hypothetical protein